MGKFKGTKGNWVVRNEHGLLFVESPKEDLGTPYGQEILSDDYHKEYEKIHDAHLVASAPKMLTALQFAVEAFSQYEGAHGTEKCEAFIRMKNVIDKALNV